jgi:hypothetical protein
MAWIVHAISTTKATARTALTGLLSIGHDVQLRLSRGRLAMV